MPFQQMQCAYCNAIGALPLRRRLITSLGRRRWRYVIPLLILHAHSHPLILVVKVFVAIIHPSPNLLLHIAGNQVRVTGKSIGSKCRVNKPEACAGRSGRADRLGSKGRLTKSYGGTSSSEELTRRRRSQAVLL